MSIHPYNEGSRAIEDVENIKVWTSWPATQPTPSIKIGTPVRKLGIEFRWSQYHKTSQQLEPLRNIGDQLADHVINLLQAGQDVIPQLMKLEQENQPQVINLMQQLRHVPSWVDWERIERGQRVHARHGAGSGIVLFNLSLVGGYISPRINRVLMSTGYLSTGSDTTYRRLLETTQFVLDVMKDADALRVGGEGWCSTIRVRFLHTHVRQRLLNSSSFQVEKDGIPINQEDLQVTLLAFSYNVLVGLEIMGFIITNQDRDDLMHLWRYIGYLIGIEEEYNPCESFIHAKSIIESMVMHQVEPDFDSARMAHHNLHAVAFRPPIMWSFNCLAQMSRMLMGDVLADTLLLPKSYYYKYILYLMFRIMRTVTTIMPEKWFIQHNRIRLQYLITQTLKTSQNTTGRTSFEYRRPITSVEKHQKPLKTHQDMLDRQSESEQRVRWWYLRTLVLSVCLYRAYQYLSSFKTVN